jgi:hypothetical protein
MSIEYEIDREMFHTTDSRAQLHFAFVTPSAEGLDKLYAVRAASGRAAGIARYSRGGKIALLRGGASIQQVKSTSSLLFEAVLGLLLAN